MQSACTQHQGFVTLNAQLGSEPAHAGIIALLLKRHSAQARPNGDFLAYNTGSQGPVG